MNSKRIQKALTRVEGQTPYDLSLPQAAFNLVSTGSGGVFELIDALEKWADTILGPEGNGEGRWADDGGGHLE